MSYAESLVSGDSWASAMRGAPNRLDFDPPMKALGALAVGNFASVQRYLASAAGGADHMRDFVATALAHELAVIEVARREPELADRLRAARVPDVFTSYPNDGTELDRELYRRLVNDLRDHLAGTDVPSAKFAQQCFDRRLAGVIVTYLAQAADATLDDYAPFLIPTEADRHAATASDGDVLAAVLRLEMGLDAVEDVTF